MKFFCGTGCRKRAGGRYRIACPVCCGWRSKPYVPPPPAMPLKAHGFPPERNEKGQWLPRVP